jgi:ATP adenylyltransferase
MERVWSPWRSEYIETLNDKDKKENECFICNAINSSNEDEKFLIVARRKKCIVIMNKYPYNSGHILVCPLRHISEFEEFEIDELQDIMITIQEVVAAMKEELIPHGFNIGLNIGYSAGAGLPGHLHFHIVPRWNGDANFTATIADVKFFPTSLEDTRSKLSKKLKTKD